MARKLEKWTDPGNPESFRSEEAWRRYTGLKKHIVRKYLSSQDAFTLHKTPRRKFRRRKVIATNINDQWVIDLADMSKISAQNNGVNFLMVAIDVVSRKLYVATMQSKHASSSLAALKAIFTLSGQQPKFIQYDKGSEFRNTTLKKFLKSKGIKAFSTEDDAIKGSMVERANRTLKRQIYMYMTQNNTDKYVDVLQNLVDSYNNSIHRSIGMTPNQVNKNNVVFALYHNQNKIVPRVSKVPHLKVGDTVKLLGRKKLMDRGFQIQWTIENHIIRKVMKTKPVTYAVEDLLGEPIAGSWYRSELQPVQKPEFFQIEKKIKSRVKNGKKEWLIKWLGYGAKFNTWEPASEIP